jgi:hypothetical protein
LVWLGHITNQKFSCGSKHFAVSPSFILNPGGHADTVGYFSSDSGTWNKPHDLVYVGEHSRVEFKYQQDRIDDQRSVRQHVFQHPLVLIGGGGVLGVVKESNRQRWRT